jgi:hypothetical protein
MEKRKLANKKAEIFVDENYYKYLKNIPKKLWP